MCTGESPRNFRSHPNEDDTCSVTPCTAIQGQNNVLGNACSFTKCLFTIFVPLNLPPPNQQSDGFPLEVLLKRPQTELWTLSQDRTQKKRKNCEQTELWTNGRFWVVCLKTLSEPCRQWNSFSFVQSGPDENDHTKVTLGLARIWLEIITSRDHQSWEALNVHFVNVHFCF